VSKRERERERDFRGIRGANAKGGVSGPKPEGEGGFRARIYGGSERGEGEGEEREGGAYVASTSE